VKTLIVFNDPAYGTERSLQRTPTRASLVFDGIPVTAAKDGVWQIEADGRVASARFLDEAAPQSATRLLIQLLYLANQRAVL